MSSVKSCIFCPQVATCFTNLQESDDSIRKVINFVAKILDVGDHLLGDVKFLIRNGGTTSFCPHCALIFSQVGDIYRKLAPLIDKIEQNLISKGQILVKEENEREEIAVKCEVDEGTHIQNVLEDDDDMDDAAWSPSRGIADHKEEYDDDNVEDGGPERDPLESDVDPSSPTDSPKSFSTGPPPAKIRKIASEAIQSEHPQVNPGMCTICGENSEDLLLPRGAQNHSIAHELERYQDRKQADWRWPTQQECPLSLTCSYSTTNPIFMWKHVLKASHLPQTLTCPVCRDVFILKSLYNAHILLHETQTPVICSICNKTFLSGTAYLAHKSSWHCKPRTRKVTDPPPRPPKIKKPSKRECPTCGKIYFGQARFQMHVRSHLSIKERRKKPTCEFCPFSIISSEKMAIHVITTHEVDPNLEKVWKCDLCEKGFVSSVVFHRHQRFHKLDKTGRTLKCEICEYPFLPGDDDKLKKHINEFHAKTNRLYKIHHCTAEGCGFTARNKFQIRRHERQDHPELLIYSCDSCGKSYSSQILLQTHNKTHGTGPFGCIVCRMVCETGEKLTQHLARHNGESITPCDQCDLLFQNASRLSIHKIVKHNATSPHPCSLCQKKFLSSSQLRHHTDMKHSSPDAPTFLCSQCPLDFKTNRSLMNHIKRVHTPNQVHSTLICEICGFSTKAKKSLKLHMLRMHDDKAELEKAKKHRCYFCDKMFLTWSEFLLHFSIHTGERQYICHICGKDFTQGHTLKGHFKLHKENGTFYPKPDDFFGIKKEVEEGSEVRGGASFPSLEEFMP